MKNWSNGAAALMLCIAGSASLISAGRAQAQTFDKRTIYKFSGAVEMPGVSLPAGEYVFRLADPDGGRQVLQVLSGDEKKVYGMFFSMPIQADKPADTPQVRFYETASGHSPAIRAVWYTGESNGREFIYPREQAMRIARTTNEPVLTTASSTTKAEETNTGGLARIDGSGKDVNADASASNAPAPVATSGASTPVATDQDRTPAPSGAASDPTAGRSTAAARTELPRTASSTPTLMLLGILSLLVAAGFRFSRISLFR